MDHGLAVSWERSDFRTDRDAADAERGARPRAGADREAAVARRLDRVDAGHRRRARPRRRAPDRRVRPHADEVPARTRERRRPGADARTRGSGWGRALAVVAGRDEVDAVARPRGRDAAGRRRAAAPERDDRESREVDEEARRPDLGSGYGQHGPM